MSAIFLVHCKGTESAKTVINQPAPSTPAKLRDDVLVIVNANSKLSTQIGEYYIQKRKIDPKNLVRVYTQDIYKINWPEFEILRDQIINHMQVHTFKDPSITPVVCTGTPSPYYCDESVTQLRENTNIRYLVTTIGLPVGVYVDFSTMAYKSPTSLDNYLMYWITNYLTSDIYFRTFSEREKAFKDGRDMRIVDPKIDKELIVGRLAGLDLPSAKAMIDRTLDAEANGIYGKLYGSKYGVYEGTMKWRDYTNNRIVYGDANIAWRYQLGLWGENRPQCLSYLDYANTLGSGKTPPECSVQLTGGATFINDPAPASTNSARQPLPFDALMYLGNLDGQSTTGSFDRFLYWRKNNTCTITLCENAADPALCRQNSTDSFKEINTECVGVADGFIGYNYQSFPATNFAIWPTKWNGGSSSPSTYIHPEVRTDDGHNDNFSLWFRNSDEVDSPVCFSSSDFSSDPTTDCRSEFIATITQNISLSDTTLNTTTPQSYKVGFWAKSENLNKSVPIKVKLTVTEKATNTVVNYPLVTAATLPLGGDPNWTYFETTIPLNPALHASCASPCVYNMIAVTILSNNSYLGAIGIDDVSTKETTDNVELIANNSFDQGHKSVNTGDHPANFLSRLNGVAFWGSLSHHESGGHSFGSHVGETLVYFLRGLPLGDSVWFGEQHNSGILYGDPIYSPVAVKFDYINDFADRFNGNLKLYASTINGRDPAKVKTTYEVSYCSGRDFFVCDQSDSWLPTGIQGVGGKEHHLLGTWQTNTLAWGDYTLRLNVRSENKTSGKIQDFYDYYPVRNWKSCNIQNDTSTTIPTNLQEWDDTDGDGFGNPCDADDDNDTIADIADAFPYDSSEWADNDGDNIGDNADLDDDNDGIPDAYEIANGLNPLIFDANDDADGDGVINVIEYARGTDPNSNTSLPTFQTYYVDIGNTSGVEDGSALHPHNTIAEGMAAAQSGDTLDIAFGTYPETLLIAGKSLRVNGHGSTVNAVTVTKDTTTGASPAQVNIGRVNAKGLTIQNADSVHLNNIVISQVTSITPVQIAYCTNTDADHILVKAPYFALRVLYSQAIRFTSSTFVGGYYSLASIKSDQITFNSSILSGASVGTGGTTNVSFPYSILSVTPTGELSAQGTGLVIADPQFVNAANSDYHLMSTSPGVDAGDPSLDYSLEPSPNGGRVNSGFYGNTSEAATTP